MSAKIPFNDIVAFCEGYIKGCEEQINFESSLIDQVRASNQPVPSVLMTSADEARGKANAMSALIKWLDDNFEKWEAQS